MKKLTIHHITIISFAILLCLLLLNNSAMAFKVYTNEEYKKLSEEEREIYCNEAPIEIERLKNEEKKLIIEKAELEKEIDTLTPNLNETNTKLIRVNEEYEIWSSIEKLENDILEFRNPDNKIEATKLLKQLEEIRILSEERGISDETNAKLNALEKELKLWLILEELENDITELENRAKENPNDSNIKMEKQNLLERLKEIRSLK